MGGDHEVKKPPSRRQQYFFVNSSYADIGLEKVIHRHQMFGVNSERKICKNNLSLLHLNIFSRGYDTQTRYLMSSDFRHYLILARRVLCTPMGLNQCFIASDWTRCCYYGIRMSNRSYFSLGEWWYILGLAWT
jgi:hypothetical protein